MVLDYLRSLLSDPVKLAAIISTIVAAFALVVSYSSYRISKHALKLTERQFQNRQPSLNVYLKNSFVKFPTQKQSNRFYAMLISITNRSDSNNSASQIDLHVTLSPASDTEITIKLPVDSSLSKQFPFGGSKLETPLRIDAHQTVVGWCYFALSLTLINQATIQGYKLVLTDTHGNSSSLEASLFTPLFRKK